ncbi:MAG: hypothetical protein RL742_1444 [Bacteroidota bacterium]|jgi:CRP-like cAMP-binding protein
MRSISTFIDEIVPLTSAEKETIENAFREIHVPKGTIWIKQGKICDQVAYLVDGKMRIFYYNDAGDEITCYFVTPDNVFTSFTSFLTNTPSAENISAIEDATLKVISKDNLEALSISIPKMHIFRRVIAENLFITMEKRIAALQSQSAAARYENMLRENPDILLSVPLQYTASFLGITPQHLSRLRKELLK